MRRRAWRRTRHTTRGSQVRENRVLGDADGRSGRVRLRKTGDHTWRAVRHGGAQEGARDRKWVAGDDIPPPSRRAKPAAVNIGVKRGPTSNL